MPVTPQLSTPSERVPRTYTPKHLADKILQSRSALQGERKQVTVLFADVKGSMELAEKLDPEVWHLILERFFEILTEGVHRFEGTVNQYTGDGVMALFGAPIAHEDHAQRACYAALHMRDQLATYADQLRIDPGVNFSFRMGLNSGEVVVGRIGDDLRMDYTAQGHTVGLAQRMEQLAPADGIALAQHTHKFVDGFFNTRSLGPVSIKGTREPVGVYILEGVGSHRTRLDTSRARGLSRFVGRSDETAMLQSALQRSLEGSGRVAAVVGEPGVGKSRLCAEFVESCRAQGLLVYEAHCPAHGRTIPYLPLLELLRNLFGITDQDGPREARQKIAGELALLDDGFAEDRALVLDFLGVADPKTPVLLLEPTVRQRRLFAFLRRLIQLRTQAEPMVLLVDDLHWIDPGSDLFVAQIVEAVASTHTLLLVNFRPEYEADWTRRSWVLQLPMAPLDAQALTDLVRDWVGTDPSVAALPALIGPRSGGNPFFAEEIVLSLLDTGKLTGVRGNYILSGAVDTLEIPATVQSLVAARIDRLAEQEKQVLYTAAVIGKEFANPLLTAAIDMKTEDLDAAISGLLTAELINERSLYPVAEYSFKHPLTHEVALGSQLKNLRRARHAAVAQAITLAEADRLDESAGLVAHHWTEAGEAMRAAVWCVRAALWVRNTDLLASRQYWAQARRLLVPLPESAERTRLLLEVYPELVNLLDRLGADPLESETVFQEAVDLARKTGDRHTEALLEALYSQLKSSQNEFDSMVEHASRAIVLADADADLPVSLLARHFLARGYAWQARWKESIAIFDQNIANGGGDEAAAISLAGWFPYVETWAIRSACLALSGDVREGLKFGVQFPRLRHAAGPGADLSSAAADRFFPCWISGDAALAKRYSDEALQMAERQGTDRNIVYALMTCGNASTLGLRWEEGSLFLERARERIESTGAGGEWSGFIYGFQALCLAGMGDRDLSLARANTSMEHSSAEFQRSAGVIRARVLRMVNGPHKLHELEAQIAETPEVLLRSNTRGLLPLLLLERAGLARMRGDVEGMTDDLAQARHLFAQMGVTGWDDYARSIEGGSGAN
ncbi:MAG: AAA family ATPase [Proteobacteria bacterium]|nr:AAA family ATPase [Pseudomonadota bacterium]